MSAVRESRAWGWVEHLRDGGTTPWRDWTSPGADAGRVLPGAQQLELLRRLNEAGRPSATLAERVLAASAPGRGRPDLELIGAAPESRFGPRPVDPATLPDRELLRVASMIIAEDVAAAGLPAPLRAGWIRPWRRRYRLMGDPELADPLRARLVARGRPPGGPGARVLLLGTSLDRMLVDAWTHRAFDSGAPGWRAWIDALVRRDVLPQRVDLLRPARIWAERIGRGHVHIVLDPAHLPALLGTRWPIVQPEPLPGEAPDLSRRVAPALGLLVPPERRSELLQQTLRPRLAGMPAAAHRPGRPVGVPPGHLPWIRTHAQRIADGLIRGGYALHGDPALLQPGEPAAGGAPPESMTLALAMRVMLEGPLRDGSGRPTEEEA